MTAAAKRPRREIFVLTPGEKKAVAFTLATLMLGLGTMAYRSKNPRPPAPLTQKEQREAKQLERRLQRQRGETTPPPRRAKRSPGPKRSAGSADE
jgi:hypothetical protein